MSRFRRQSLVKPLAAEVLEPRCLMTEATGTLAAADAAPLTGAVVVDASLWDDAGLTLQQVGDLLHVFRTDTQTDVITPMLAREITSLNIIGRDNAADVLTLDFSFGWSLIEGTLHVNLGTDRYANSERRIEAVVVDASLWDDAGLTLQRVGDLLYVFRADTQIAVFPTLPASEMGDLNIVSGADATNILRADPWDVVRLLETYTTDFVTVTGEVGYAWLWISPPDPEDPTPDADAEPHWANYASQELWLAAYQQWLIDQAFVSDPESNSSSESRSETYEPAPSLADYVNEDDWLADYSQWLIAHGFLGPDESSDADHVLVDGSGVWLAVLPSPVLLIGQGIATVGIEDRELTELDTASSDSAFGELADFEPEDGGDLAANDDTNSADVGDELELDAALSDELLASLADPLWPDAGF